MLFMRCYSQKTLKLEGGTFMAQYLWGILFALVGSLPLHAVETTEDLEDCIVVFEEEYEYDDLVEDEIDDW